MSKENSPKESVWSSFTNKYALSKTLRFSLIPILTKKQEEEVCLEKGYKNINLISRQDRVEKFFSDNRKDFFEVDVERKKRYKALKYYLTELHRLFIKDSLNVLKKDQGMDYTKLFTEYKEYEKCRDDAQKKKLAQSINAEKIVLAKNFGDAKGKGGVFQKMAANYYTYLENNLGINEVGKKEKINGGGDDKKRFRTGAENILLSQNVLTILKKKVSSCVIVEYIEKDKTGNNAYSLKFVDVNGSDDNLFGYFDGL